MKSSQSFQEELIQGEKEKLARADQKLEELEGRQAECQAGLESCEGQVRRLTRNLNQQQQEYQAVSTRLESLQNLAERYEGYGNSIRRVMETRGRVQGILGVVADLITTEKQYETAIETALGGSIQNVVTDSEKTAKALIEYLKKNRYGRVTFLPLTSIGQGAGFSRPEALQEPGVVGLASDLVHVGPEYQVLAKYLLGRVVVADTIDHALALAKKYRYSLRIVTLEGELLSAGGSMTGGAFKNSSNLLGRKREIEELEAACKKALAVTGQVQQELAAQEGLLARKKEELEQIKVWQHEASLLQNTLRLNVNQLEEKRDEIQDSSQDLELENRQLESQIQDIEENRARIARDTKELLAQNQQISLDVEEMSARLEEAKAVREVSARQLEEIRLEAAALKQKVDFVEENIRRVEQEIRRLERERAQLEAVTGDSGRVIDAKRQEIQRLRQQIQEAVERRESLGQEAEGLEKRKGQMAMEQKGLFQRREELAGRISRLDKELFRLQSQKEKLDEKLDSLVNYMWNEYEMTFTTAEPLRDPGLTAVSEIRKEIEGLKNEIRALGNVNVNAIEDYKEVSQRYEFMKTQHGDLVEAEQTLLQIIDELDKGMRRQFEEKFREISSEFDRAFKELFGGGHGTLELVEGEDVLESGIQIIAQPPGKKLQNMMQLSGGEKALTAISLLFAIQNLKPSPFCLLDEIEAALDDSNVDRFARYLHKLIKNTQFIVITHRRGTMVASDRLYGITMQEKGVSTMVSVNLIEGQLDA